MNTQTQLNNMEDKNMKPISETAPKVKVFEGLTKVEKTDLIDKDIVIHAFARMTGDDGDYAVAIISAEGMENSTTSFSHMLLKRFETSLESVGEDKEKGNDVESYFKEPITAKLVQVQSKKDKNRKYFDLI